MRLLLDTTLLIDASRDELAMRDARITQIIRSASNTCFVSAASLWEISIKTRLGKLDPLRPLHELPDYLEALGFTLLPINHRHAVSAVEPLPATRDPFDRLLLAQCAIEDLRLVTVDRALVEHPLAWRRD